MARELITTRKFDKQHRIHIPSKYLIACGMRDGGDITEEEVLVICRDKKIIIEKEQR